MINIGPLIILSTLIILLILSILLTHRPLILLSALSILNLSACTHPPSALLIIMMM